MTGSVWKMRSAGKDTMTQYHRIHPNLSLTQNPTSRDLLVAFQIPISLMELQMEEAVVVVVLAVAALAALAEEAKIMMAGSRLTPRG